jgi:drug/metabolite transporter (DMT)-like permease
MPAPGLPRGVASGLGAAVLFGLSTPFAKLLLPSSGPLMLAGLLYLGAGIGLTAIAPFRRTDREAPLRLGDLPTLAAMVVAGGIAGPILLLVGLARLPGGEASLLLNLEAPFTIGIAVLFFDEYLARREVVGAAAVVLGGLVLASGPSEGSMRALGALAVSGAGLAWAIDNNLSQRLSLRDPVAVTRMKTLVAGGVNVTVAMAMGDRLPGTIPLAGALLTGFLGYGLSIVLHLLALRHIGTARQAAYLATAPFIGAVASVPILGEQFTWKEVAAGLAMGAGVTVLVRARHGHRHVHEAMEHDHAHVHDEHHDHTHSLGAPPEPHSHLHQHTPLAHDHPHHPDLHHRHRHRGLDPVSQAVRLPRPP